MADEEQIHTSISELVSACLAHYREKKPLPAELTETIPQICEYLLSAAHNGEQSGQDENLILYLLGDKAINTGQTTGRLETICQTIFDNLPESNRDILDATMYITYQIEPPPDLAGITDEAARIEQYMQAINARRFREYLMLNRRSPYTVSTEVYSSFFLLNEHFANAGHFGELGDLVSGNPRLGAVTQLKIPRDVIGTEADWPQGMPRWERNANAAEPAPDPALYNVEIVVKVRGIDTIDPGGYL